MKKQWLKGGFGMELRQLKYFLAVADARSFVSAAGELFVSRQAVSKAVGQLEAELGVELFVRDSSGAFLTPAGLMFYDRVRSSVMELERVRTEMQRFGPRYLQRVRVVLGMGILQMYEKALQSFRIEQENLALEYAEYPDSECFTALREHKADLAVCACQPPGEEFSAQILAQSPYGVLIRRSDTLNAEETLELRDLSWLPMAGLRDGATEAAGHRYGLQFQYTGYDLYRLFALARDGICALLLPQCQVPEGMEGLQWLPLSDMEEWKLYGICLRTQENNVLYHTTIDELQSEVFMK